MLFSAPRKLVYMEEYCLRGLRNQSNYLPKTQNTYLLAKLNIIFLKSRLLQVRSLTSHLLLVQATSPFPASGSLRGTVQENKRKYKYITITIKTKAYYSIY